MEIYKCYVPRNEYYLAKSKIAIIYERYRLDYQQYTDAEFDKRIAQAIRNRFQKAKGTKSMLEILKEYLEDLKNGARI